MCAEWIRNPFSSFSMLWALGFQDTHMLCSLTYTACATCSYTFSPSTHTPHTLSCPLRLAQHSLNSNNCIFCWFLSGSKLLVLPFLRPLRMNHPATHAQQVRSVVLGLAHCEWPEQVFIYPAARRTVCQAPSPPLNWSL